tara:strand:- start:34565 stop:35944 length:1380 start_codon:yes stop_codon:yes gene_type:complete
MPVGTKVGAASSGGNIKLRDSIGKVVGPAEYTSSNFRLGSLSKGAWINRRDYGNRTTDGSTLVQETSPDNFYSYYSSGDADASDYQQDGSWNGGGPNGGINDNAAAGMGEFAGIQNDYFTVGTQLVGAGVPQRYIGFSPLTSSYQHAAGARNDFGAGTSFQNYTIGTYCRRNGDHLSIFVGATKNGSLVGTDNTTPNRGFGSINATTRLAGVFTTPYGNTQPVDYNLHGSTANSQIAWYDGDSSSNSTDPFSNQKEIYRLENACSSTGPTAEPHSGGNGTGQQVHVQVLSPITTINVNGHPGCDQLVRRYVDNGTTSFFSSSETLMTSTNTVIGAEIVTKGFMTDNSGSGFQSLGIVVPFLISINGSGTGVFPSSSITGTNSGSSSTLNNQTYSGGQGVLQDNNVGGGSHSPSDMIRTGFFSQKLIMVGIRADSDKTSSGSPQTFIPGFNPGGGNFPLF